MTCLFLLLFDPGQDRCRVKTVMDTWIAKGHEAISPFDGARWPGLAAQGRDAILSACQAGLAEAQVAIVLIDTRTSENEWVRFAVKAAHDQRRALLGIHIHKLPGCDGLSGQIGNSRFGELEPGVFFWQRYPLHRWIVEDGAHNLEAWVEEAVQVVEPS